MCVARIYVHQVPRNEQYDAYGDRRDCAPSEGLDTSMLQPTSKSMPYNRKTYFNERLAQWREQEPSIPREHCDVIEQAYAEQYPQHYAVAWDQLGRRPAGRTAIHLHKHDIRRILVAANTKSQYKRFVHKYYEKFLTIRHYLTGLASLGTTIEGDLCERLRRRFQMIEVAFNHRVKGGNRYAMLSYNFVMRRILDLEGVSFYGVDFPPLKSENKRKRLCTWWLRVCNYLLLPYLNSDHRLFPGFDNYSAYELRRRDSDRHR